MRAAALAQPDSAPNTAARVRIRPASVRFPAASVYIRNATVLFPTADHLIPADNVLFLRAWASFLTAYDHNQSAFVPFPPGDGQRLSDNAQKPAAWARIPPADRGSTCAGRQNPVARRRDPTDSVQSPADSAREPRDSARELRDSEREPRDSGRVHAARRRIHRACVLNTGHRRRESRTRLEASRARLIVCLSPAFYLLRTRALIQRMWLW